MGKAANVGVVRVFYLKADEADFHERIDPLIRKVKRSLGQAAADYGWTSVAMDDPKMKLNCHNFPCVVANQDNKPSGGVRYVFGDYKEEVWSVRNMRKFFEDVASGRAEGVNQGELRRQGPKYTKPNKEVDEL